MVRHLEITWEGRGNNPWPNFSKFNLLRRNQLESITMDLQWFHGGEDVNGRDISGCKMPDWSMILEWLFIASRLPGTEQVGAKVINVFINHFDNAAFLERVDSLNEFFGVPGRLDSVTTEDEDETWVWNCREGVVEDKLIGADSKPRFTSRLLRKMEAEYELQNNI